MKFAHMSDCHIGSWQRNPKLSDASTKAFSQAIDICISEKVDFILISGDLFDTSLPSMDKLQDAVEKLKQAKDKGIQIYVIPGSHDYTPSGKTMLDVLETAGVFTNTYRITENADDCSLEFVVDEKTGAKIAGMAGKKGGMEKVNFSRLAKENLHKEDGFKIFMFHSGIEEFKPKHLEQMEATPLEHLPKNFDYYAAGHIHHPFTKKIDGLGLLSFPGPLFPNNFDELERLESGGFYIIERSSEIKQKFVPVKVHDRLQIKIDCNGKTPRQVESSIIDSVQGKYLANTIVALRLFGTITGGKTTDINLKAAYEEMHKRGAHCVLRNTSDLTSEFYEEQTTEAGSVENIEDELIKQNAGKIKLFKENEITITKSLLETLNIQKEEGERQADFERRVIRTVEKVLDIKL